MTIDRLLDEQDSLGLADLVRRREVSAGELLEAAIARAEAADARLNFMSQRHYEFARKAVAAGLPEGPFTGVPWLLKDLNTYIDGEITEGGSHSLKGFRASVTSELVKRIQAAGFVIFGKTTTPEFGLTVSTESRLKGLTRNPWNPERIAGGSSGGAAAAVAAGVIPAAHATDGGGSIRIPAACCGLFGLKPSRGRVPMGPIRTEGWGGMSTHHAVSWTVRDSAAVLDATHGVEPGSRYAAPNPAGTFLEAVRRPPGRLRIALMTAPLIGTPVDPEVVAAVRAAAKLCEELGHVVEEASPKVDGEAVRAAGFSLISASVAADVDGWAQANGVAVDDKVFEVGTLAFAHRGRQVTGAEFARANGVMQTAAIEIARFQQSYDVILAPTVAKPPVELGILGMSPTDLGEWGRQVNEFSPFTAIYNGTGQPSMSVPLGMSSDGLPIGIMFTGRFGEEALLLSLAGQLEQAAPWRGRKPAQ